MLDDHFYPSNWGVRPVLFRLGTFDIPSYSFFVLLGLAVGAAVYFYEAKKQKSLNENGFLIAIGSLTGAAIGAKILELMVYYKLLITHLSNWEVIASGRTIVGGLIGGAIGAVLTKKILGVKEKRGNLFAPAIAMGVAIGRLGCFFRGCCYGQPTNLPWGVNFGDGIPRHPTQLYESLFMLAMFVYLEKVKNKENIKPGQLFKTLMISYFTFRFFLEFIRVEPVVFAGLTLFQIISIGVIIYLVRGSIKIKPK
jgi:phosphatidylglycerol---prolipoprotein diacylglyceryl transferase